MASARRSRRASGRTACRGGKKEEDGLVPPSRRRRSWNPFKKTTETDLLEELSTQRSEGRRIQEEMEAQDANHKETVDDLQAQLDKTAMEKDELKSLLESAQTTEGPACTAMHLDLLTEDQRDTLRQAMEVVDRLDGKVEVDVPQPEAEATEEEEEEEPVEDMDADAKDLVQEGLRNAWEAS